MRDSQIAFNEVAIMLWLRKTLARGQFQMGTEKDGIWL